MENIQVMLKQILPNPFKKEIDNGKLNEEQVQKLMEGYKMTSFHENILARRSKEHDDKYELVYGHHRLEAARRLYGNNHEINLNIVNYTDDQMMIDLCRENLTQGRHGSFNSELDSTLLVKRYLESIRPSVNSVDTRTKKGQFKKGVPNTSEGVGARQIAKFLSKEGKLVSHETINRILKVHQNLAPEILEKVVKKRASGKEEGVGFSEAIELSQIKDHAQQKKILEIVENTHGRKAEAIRNIVSSPEEARDRMMKGDLSLISKPIVKLEEDAMPNGVIGLRFMKRSLELINEMRFLRNTLSQFRKDKLFEHFTPKQRGNFSEKLTTIKQEYGELVDELEKSLEELK